jgi:hypothetical protein
MKRDGLYGNNSGARQNEMERARHGQQKKKSLIKRAADGGEA